MPFRFPLEPLLHLRKSFEHQHELRLRAANQQLAKIRHLVDQLEQQRAHILAAQSQYLQRGATAAELHFQAACENSVRQEQIDAERQLMRLQNLRDQQQRIYQHARREREIVESLREQQLSEYKQQASRREQRLLDDLQLLRRVFFQNR